MFVIFDLLPFLIQIIFPNFCILLLFLCVSKWQKPNLKTVLVPVVGLVILSYLDSFFSSGYKSLSSGDLQFIFGSFPPALPLLDDSSLKEYEKIKTSLLELRKSEGSTKTTDSDRWALVTGASSGIGRSIAVQLARRHINLVVVGRNTKSLSFLKSELQSCYGISVHIVSADLGKPNESRRVFDHVVNNLRDVPVINYLILNAGIGPTALHTDLGKDHLVEKVVRVNVESTASLASLFGNAMRIYARNNHQVEGLLDVSNPKYHPRIMIVSSVAGMIPAIPGAALYAATKAFGYHLAEGLSIEMESMGISVTSLCPGATTTNFAAQSKMEDALLWKFSFLVFSADSVADQAVNAMFLGVSNYIPGFINRITIQFITPFVPSRISKKIFRFLWQPWPFPSFHKSNNISTPKEL